MRRLHDPNRDVLNATVVIVTAYISAQPSFSVDGIIDAVHAVHEALSSQLHMDPPVPSAVDPRQSVFTDHLVCLECGAEMRVLRRHLRIIHGLTEGQYRQRHRLPITYPLVSPAYSKQRAEMARDSRPGRNR